MSEVQSRPVASRGRGSARGGRGGGHSTRGGSRVASRTAAPNGDSKHTTDSALPSFDDDAELGEIKKKYGSKINIIREVCPGWSEADAAYALDETNGDENVAIDRILGGLIQKWEQSNKKERTRPKGKNDTFTTTTADSAPAGGARPARGGRGTESGRSGRGRATERGGRGGARGKSTPATTNGTRTKDSAQLSVPTEEAYEWKSGDEGSTAAPETPAETAPVTAVAPVAVSKPVSSENAPKTWASMLRESTAPKPAPKPKEAPTPKLVEPTIEPLPPAEPIPVEPETPTPERELTPEPEEPPVAAPEPAKVVVPEIALAPSKDQLTETNLEQIADESHPAPTGTARSEATDSWDPRAQAPSATATPSSASQQQHQARAPTSGFAATATKATERSATRTPSHSRRILEQREAVRMPGNRDQVDRAAVQFGAFSLNGPIDDDIDGDREEPETRPQPPEDSPVAHPRTSLPPVQPAPVPEAFPVQKPVSSLPTGPAAASAPTAPQAAPSAPSQGAFDPRSQITLFAETVQLIPYPQTVVQPPTAPSAQQYGRFGQPVPQEPASFQASSKPFDSFPQQQQSATAAQSQFDGGFPSQAQAAQAAQSQTQQPGGAFSSAPSEFTSYYTADPQSRNAYNYYNQGFGQQQGAQSQQEGLSSQAQRSFSNYNAPQNDNLSQYPQSGAQGRFGSAAGAEAQAGTNPSPNQTATQAQASQSAQSQSHGHQPQDFYGNHPYSYNPYYSNYMGYQGGYSQGAYTGPYGKGGLGYQPSQYGMSPQGPHGYGSTPAGGFGQSSGLHRESGIGAGLSDYTRAGSGQSAQQQGLASSGFGGMPDAFSRNASAYQSQAGQSFNAPGPQPGNVPSASDELKPFGDAKAVTGPSPSLGAAARPGSAANNAPSQTGLPPPQSSQGGYAYPGHLQGHGHGLHGNQSGAGGYGMSASGGQGHQNSYGAYGNQGFGNYYGNPPRGGGWGTNYH